MEQPDLVAQEQYQQDNGARGNQAQYHGDEDHEAEARYQQQHIMSRHPGAYAHHGYQRSQASHHQQHEAETDGQGGQSVSAEVQAAAALAAAAAGFRGGHHDEGIDQMGMDGQDPGQPEHSEGGGHVNHHTHHSASPDDQPGSADWEGSQDMAGDAANQMAQMAQLRAQVRSPVGTTVTSMTPGYEALAGRGINIEALNSLMAGAGAVPGGMAALSEQLQGNYEEGQDPDQLASGHPGTKSYTQSSNKQLSSRFRYRHAWCDCTESYDPAANYVSVGTTGQVVHAIVANHRQSTSKAFTAGAPPTHMSICFAFCCASENLACTVSTCLPVQLYDYQYPHMPVCMLCSQHNGLTETLLIRSMVACPVQGSVLEQKKQTLAGRHQQQWQVSLPGQLPI